MGAKSTIELLLELKDRATAGIKKHKAKVTQGVESMKRKIHEGSNAMRDRFSKAFDGIIPSVDRLGAKNAAMFGALKDQVPFLGRFAELLKNPYVLAAAAVVGLALLLGKATNAAAEFSYQFLDIRQLNLDKPKEELDKYSESILNLSYETGVAQNKMAQGFYDVQSATGLFGDEVANLNKQVADYSIATKADFNDSINSSVKAMKAFGFGVNEVSDYLASNAKTVQVGITTFNELAKVQTEFAGAAAGAGQTFDTANKIFAAFTAIAKDSTIAATLTKSALEGLTQARTIKEMKKIGVNLFDAKGQMKSLDGVIKELTPKLQGMSDIQFLKFRNSIGGPEGLQNLLNTLKGSGDDVLKTFDAFDKSSFNMDKALSNAKNEAKVLKEELGNKLSVIMIEIGNKILPVWTATLKGINWLVDRIRDGASFLYRVWLLQWKAIKGLWEGVKYLFSILAEGINWVYNKLGGSGDLFDNIFGTLDRWAFKIKIFFEDLKTVGMKTFQFLEAGLSGDLVRAGKLMKELKNFYFRDADLLYNFRDQLKGKTGGDDPDNTGPSFSPGDGGAMDLEGGVSGASQVRNLTIHIDAFNKDGITVVKEGDVSSMTEEQLEQWFNRMMMRVIRNVETTVQ